MDVVTGMPGRVAEIQVAVGDAVSAGQDLLVLESMKMLLPISAPADGTISELLVEVGQQVEEGDLLMRLTTA